MDFLRATNDGDMDKVKALLKQFPNANLNHTTDPLGNTPLTLAVKKDYPDVSTELSYVAMATARLTVIIIATAKQQ